MPLTVTHLDGEYAGQVQTFADDVEIIVVGRDPDKCQIVLPPDARVVGREHCTITRIRGRYVMDVSVDRVVRLKGELMVAGDAIPQACEIQIGPDGPTLGLQAVREHGLASTANQELSERELAERSAPTAKKFEVEEAAAAGRSGKRVAVMAGVVAILALCIGSVIWVWTAEETATLRQADAEQAADIVALEVRSDDMEDDLITLGADLPEIMATSGQSVLLVVKKSANGGETPLGTAFVVGPGVCATNAHVAEDVAEAGVNETVVLRTPSMNGASSVDFAVDGYELHPGYQAFAELWRGYVPVRLNASNGLDPIRSAGTACDLALLRVSEGTLPPPLELATAARQSALMPGVAVASIGFPMEGMALDGVNTLRPVPQSQIGRVTALTTFFNTSERESAETPGQVNTLVQHSIPGTGGASGSPILDGSGQVIGIVSAVNFAIIDGERIPTGAGVNFAQRATLLEELMDGTAENRLASRIEGWNKRVSSLYRSGQLLAGSPGINTLRSLWQSQLQNKIGTNEVLAFKPLVDLWWPLDSLHAGRASAGLDDVIFAEEINIDVEEGGYYLLAADGADDISLPDGDGGGLIDDVEFVTLGTGIRGVSFRAIANGTFAAGVETDDVDGLMEVVVIGGYSMDAVPEVALAQARNTWRLSLRDLWGVHVRDLGGKVEQITTVPAGGSNIASQDVTLAKPGYYMLVVTSDTEGDVRARMWRQVDGEEVLLAEDQSDGSGAIVMFDAHAPIDFRVDVESDEADVPCNIHIYRAVVRGDSNADDKVDIQDLIQTLSEFGNDCIAASCGGDHDEDGKVDGEDLIDVIQTFGRESKDSMPVTPLIGTQIALQSRYSDVEAGLRDHGVGNDAWCLHGSALKAGVQQTIDEFLTMPDATIQTTLRNYLRNQELSSETRDMVILDMEHPIHPKMLGEILVMCEEAGDMTYFVDVVEAFKRRITIAREMMPNARLGMYGVIVPHPFGSMGQSEIDKIRGYQEAGDFGLYDELDFIGNVLYQRFGPTDVKYGSMPEMTTVGFSTSREITRSDGSSIPVVPMLSFTIYNGGSPHHRDPILVADLVSQMELLWDAGVEELIVWNGNDLVDDTDILISDRIGEVKTAAVNALGGP